MRFVFGDCDLDTERYEFRRAGRSIALEPKVFKVLTYLLQRAGRAVAKHDLLEAFWPGISDAHWIRLPVDCGGHRPPNGPYHSRRDGSR
jgi:DNA-binding winged helix-turn-helix (wHTH) protein